MFEVSTVLMNRRSGMTTAATALVLGFISQGIKAVLVVPRAEDADWYARQHPEHRDIICYVGAIPRLSAQVLVFDDALRCEDMSLQIEGCMITDYAKRGLKPDPSDLTNIYLFQYIV